MDFKTILDDSLRKIETLEVSGYLEKEDGKIISGSIHFENNRLFATIDDEIVMNENIEMLKKKLAENLSKLLEGEDSTGKRKIEELLTKIVSADNLTKYLSPLVFFIIPLINFDRFQKTLYKLKKNIMGSSGHVEMNCNAEVEIKYNNEKYVLKAVLTKGEETIKVTFEDEDYELSVSNRFDLIISGAPLIAHIASIFRGEI
jgi:hypothetical protein